MVKYWYFFLINLNQHLLYSADSLKNGKLPNDPKASLTDKIMQQNFSFLIFFRNQDICKQINTRKTLKPLKKTFTTANNNKNHAVAINIIICIVVKTMFKKKIFDSTAREHKVHSVAFVKIQWHLCAQNYSDNRAQWAVGKPMWTKVFVLLCWKVCFSFVICKWIMQ